MLKTNVNRLRLYNFHFLLYFKENILLFSLKLNLKIFFFYFLVILQNKYGGVLLKSNVVTEISVLNQWRVFCFLYD